MSGRRAVDAGGTNEWPRAGPRALREGRPTTVIGIQINSVLSNCLDLIAAACTAAS